MFHPEATRCIYYLHFFNNVAFFFMLLYFFFGKLSADVVLLMFADICFEVVAFVRTNLR